MNYPITLVALQSDGGDGGGNCTVYGSHEALKESEWPLEDFTVEEQEENYQNALSGESMYDYGEISEVQATIEIVDGVARLVGDFHFHWGQ